MGASLRDAEGCTRMKGPGSRRVFALCKREGELSQLNLQCHFTVLRRCARVNKKLLNLFKRWQVSFDIYLSDDNLNFLAI
jgi:hypothetical protein